MTGEDLSLLGSDAKSTDECWLTFWRSMPPLTSRSSSLPYFVNP
jgi:hypothetical protein